MLYATEPILPPNIRERMQDPLNFDDPELAASSILTRSKLVERSCIIAGGNLMTAQKRDTLRYALTRSGGYLAKVSLFEVGDYVYVKQHHPGSALYPESRSEILRVKEVRYSGVLVLEGRDGRTVTENITNVSHCGLDIKNGEHDDVMFNLTPKSQHCEICREPAYEAVMVLCDSCNRGYHIFCLTPPLTAVPPKGEMWFCGSCVKAGVNVQTGFTGRAIVHNQLLSRMDKLKQAAMRRAAEKARVKLAEEAKALRTAGRAPEVIIPAKKGRGARVPAVTPVLLAPVTAVPIKRGRGRPRKVALGAGITGMEQLPDAQLPSCIRWAELDMAISAFKILMPGEWVPAMDPWIGGSHRMRLSDIQSAGVSEAGML
jgi:hypothetical protein